LLIALGLGNPGDRYEGTRHNLGKEVVEELAFDLRLSLSPGKGRFFYGHYPSGDLFLALSTTYMNTSGVAARGVLEGLGGSPRELLVVCDDFSLPLGTLRMRARGSDGGHNGLASVIYQLETEDFPRLRLGVGPVPPGLDPADYVLSSFGKADVETVDELKTAARRAILALPELGMEKTMSTFNRRYEP
jgi:PTH1 family peptidyl-tRNA hydrolase